MRPRTIGRIQGIEVRLHLSLAVVVCWAAYYWGYAADGGFAGLLYGLLLVAAIFGLVLLHELGHGLMAAQYGVRVRDITLLPFGGVARIEQLPAHPRTEAVIALAGPLTNIALAIAALPLIALWLLVSGHNAEQLFVEYRLASPSIGGFVLFLWLANLMLAVINLLPAFPMDGGRVLRSALSTVTGRNQATKIAVFIGVLFAVIIGAIALAEGEYLIPLVSIVLIGTAFAEGRAVRLEDQMRRLQVGQFAVWERGGIDPTDPLALALRDGPRDVVVTAGGKVLGMLWKADLQNALQRGWLHKRAGELMDRGIVTADSSTSVFDVHLLMSTHNQWTLPITENGSYRGMFSSERFTHVHQFLRSKTPENRHVAAFTGSLTQAIRAFVR
jgi:Zn-dependent protease